MKFFYATLITIFFSVSTLAQTKLDSMLVDVNQSSITSGIIYERVTQFANLYNFNRPNFPNSANYRYLRQALSELHRASNQTRLISLQELENRIAATTQQNQVDVAILNSSFQILNYNYKNQNAGGLKLNLITQKFSQIPNKPPFYDLNTTIIAPTKSIVKGTSATFKFHNNLFLTNGENMIKTLTINFGSTTKTIINNGSLISQSVTVPYTSSGTKEFTCIITFDDYSTLTTKGNIYFHYIPFAPPSFNTINGLCTSSDPRTKDEIVIAEESFKGYESDDPRIFPKIEYRIFYANASFHSDLKVYKPVIIIDGFDPGDQRRIQDCDCEEDPECASKNLSNGVFDPDKHRSMTDLMKYEDDFETESILMKLRSQGYDVIMVNHPTYTTTNIDTGQPVTIDGGAYYIESNALALVALIKKVKQKLVDSGSIEEIAIVGPSMGGQISRYALAYMEKKYAETSNEDWNHNTYLWVSVDSPHLGANIPVGDQALIHLASTVGGSESAQDFYNNQLGSVAAKQQLIELHRDVPNHHLINVNNLNGRVASQGYPTDDGSFYFRTYFNTQEANGLPNSHGYPENLRKVALVNGSMTSETIGTNSEKVLNIRGFQRVNIDLPWPLGSITFPVHIASLESYFMPSYGTGYHKVARFKAGFDDRSHKSPNINYRGNMDIVPGGWFPAQNDIAASVLGTSPIDGVGGSFWEYPGDNIIYWLSNVLGGSYYELRDFKFNHSFIPSFSAIAHKNPNQNWSNPLDYNLVCADDTYFDSYFGHDENTQHTSFTKKSALWLFEELAGNAQPPFYPLDADDLQGDTAFCKNEIRTFAFGACKLPSTPTWYITNNLELLDTDDVNQSITVKAIANGNANILVDIGDGRSISKNIYIGTPEVFSISTIDKLKSGLPDPIAPPGSCDDIAIRLNMLPSNQEVTSVEWLKVSNNFQWTTSDDGRAILTAQCDGTIEFKVRMKNNCGWSDWKPLTYDISDCDNDCNTSSTGSITSTNFIIYPVPVNTNLFVKLKDQPQGLLQNGDVLNIKLYTNSGLLVNNVDAVSTQTSIDVSNLSAGPYTLVLNYNGSIESHLIIVE